MNFTFSESNYFDNLSNINSNSPYIYFLPKIKENRNGEGSSNPIESDFGNKNNIFSIYNEQKNKNTSKDKKRKRQLKPSSRKKEMSNKKDKNVNVKEIWNKKEKKDKKEKIEKKEKKETKEAKEAKEGIEKKAKKEVKEKKEKVKRGRGRGKTEKKTNKEKKKRGRKRDKIGNKMIGHNKYSDDNIRKKCKHLVLKSMLKFINDKIYNLYNGNIGNGLLIKKLFILNQSQKCNDDISFNKLFLTKKLGQIFSDDITSRINCYPPFHNKKLIINLMNDKNVKIKNYFTKLFNLNFTQCLKHFTGQEEIEILKGLKTFHDFKDEIISKCDEDGLDYYDTLKYYLNNYEVIINGKKSRKKRKFIN